MRVIRSLALVLALGSLPFRGAVAAEPVLERVLLSTGGVGYLGYRAMVEGDGTLRLTVPLRQVDDILKSLTILDGGGTVRAVSLQGPAPLADLFRSTPFKEGDLADLPTLLSSLRGAELAVRGPTELRGRILSVVPEESRTDEVTTIRHRLSLLTPEGMRSVLLETEVDGLALADPMLGRQLELVLARLADNRREQERTLEIGLGGAAGREVRLGYLAEMPLWKASYRLVTGSEERGLLQGWAILENLSGQDWRDVEVTLVAGSPTALRQALFRTYFVPRPEVPVLEGPQPPGPLADGSPRAALAPSLAARGKDRGGATLMAEAAPTPAPAPLEVGAAQELTAQTLFRLPQKVSLPTGHTVMAPIVDAQVPVERLDLYRAREGGPHPEAAIRLKNDGGTSLPAGIATLYERLDGGGLTFLGDARLPALAPGAEEIVSYGRDGAVEVASSEEEESRLDRVRIADGIMELSRVERRRTRYTATGRFSGSPRGFVLEVPRPEGWRVAEPADAVTEGERVRVTRRLAPGAALELAVVLERPVVERVVLADAGPDDLALAFQGATLSPEIRQALERLQALSARIADLDGRIDAAQARRDERAAEQERLRANLEAVPPGGDLAKRYLDRLGASEDEIQALGRELEALRAERERGVAERLAFIRGLKI
jgi:hypothetical protein